MNESLDTFPACVFSFDDNGTILEANRVFEEMLGGSPGKLKGRRIGDVLAPAARIYYQTHFYPSLKLQGKLDEIYLKFMTLDRAIQLPVLVNVVRRKESDGTFRNLCVAMRMTQRDRFEDEVLRAKREAEIANEAKAKFISMMSNDLLTPLQSIFGYASFIRDDPEQRLTDAQRDDLEAIETACASVGQVLFEILQFAQLDVGATQFEFSNVPLGQAVERAEELLKPQILEAGLAYRRGSIPAGTTVWADEPRLQQILLNLVVNALKFTPSGGRIQISCRLKGEFVELNVADNGRGIPESDQKLIFEPFVQLAREHHQAQTGGVGLGLAISRTLARAMGGNLSVKSELGKGATFTVTLPQAKTAPDSNSVTKFEHSALKKKKSGKSNRRLALARRR